MLASRHFTLTPPGIVQFGQGATRTLPSAVESLGKKRAFVVTDPGIRAAGILDEVLALISTAGIATETFAEVEPNPPLATLESAAEQARPFGESVVVALGGGSSLDAAKGISMAVANPGLPVAAFDYRTPPAHPGWPLIAVPTTAGTGAETNGFGVFEDTAARCKVYLGDASVAPKVSILDPTLTVGLPPLATAATGVDALVHGIESLLSKNGHPVSQAYAHHAVRLVYASLPAAVADGSDLEARANMLLGAHLAGLALSISGLGLVHGIAHAVTAETGAAHGVALAAVLDLVLEFHRDASQSQLAEIAVDMRRADTNLDQAENARSTVTAARAFVQHVGAYRTLGDLGCTHELVPTLSHTALADPVTGSSPRIPTPEQLQGLLTAAL